MEQKLDSQDAQSYEYPTIEQPEFVVRMDDFVKQGDFAKQQDFVKISLSSRGKQPTDSSGDIHQGVF